MTLEEACRLIDPATDMDAYCGKPLKIIGTERFCNNVQCFNRFQNV